MTSVTRLTDPLPSQHCLFLAKTRGGKAIQKGPLSFFFFFFKERPITFNERPLHWEGQIRDGQFRPRLSRMFRQALLTCTRGRNRCGAPNGRLSLPLTSTRPSAPCSPLEGRVSILPTPAPSKARQEVYQARRVELAIALQSGLKGSPSARHDASQSSPAQGSFMWSHCWGDIDGH